MRKKNFYSVWTVAICFATLFLTTNTMAQSGQIQGSSSSSGDLYQERDDIGVGSADNPEARIHIFNGVYDSNPQFRGKRPFLVSGFYQQYCSDIEGNTYPCYTEPKTYFTVAKQGFVGVGYLNPNSKLVVYGTESEGWNSGIELKRQDGGNAVMVVDEQGMKFRTMTEGASFYFRNMSNTTNMIIKDNGNVGIGIDMPTEKLQVEGNVIVNGNETVNGFLEVKNGNTTNFKVKSDGYVRAREIKVDLQTIPDYVFKENYNLMPLAELKTFVETNKHLPNVKSEKEFKTEGSYALGEMNLKLLEKVEELTLYILDLQEQIDELKIK